MKTKTIQLVYFLLLLLLGASALFGGAVLIVSPSGKLFRMPISLLLNTPFNNFLIPGIILFCIIGIVPVSLVFALKKRPSFKFVEFLNFYKDMYWAWSFSIYVSFALIIWIQIEMWFLQSVHWSHTLYVFWAIAILFLALMPAVRNTYKK
jgi:hypothetical protein